MEIEQLYQEVAVRLASLFINSKQLEVVNSIIGIVNEEASSERKKIVKMVRQYNNLIIKGCSLEELTTLRNKIDRQNREDLKLVSFNNRIYLYFLEVLTLTTSNQNGEHPSNLINLNSIDNFFKEMVNFKYEEVIANTDEMIENTLNVYFSLVTELNLIVRNTPIYDQKVLENIYNNLVPNPNSEIVRKLVF